MHPKFEPSDLHLTVLVHDCAKRKCTEKGSRSVKQNKRESIVTKSVIDEVVEGVTVAVVGELVVGGRKFLEALRRHAGEVAGELGVLGEDHGAASDETVDQRLLSHRRNHNRSRTNSAARFGEEARDADVTG
ncbi:hypothetical protein CR513_18287, partial [Mucuna pruriens]